MDYKKLLEKYMKHIRDYEGRDYVNYIGESESEIVFTDDEYKELKKISNANYESAE